MNKEIIKYLKNSISEKGNYCYSLPVETTKEIIKEIDRLNKGFKYLEKYFSEREYYEFAQLVREIRDVNIEWLEKGVKEYE